MVNPSNLTGRNAEKMPSFYGNIWGVPCPPRLENRIEHRTLEVKEENVVVIPARVALTHDRTMKKKTIG